MNIRVNKKYRAMRGGVLLAGFDSLAHWAKSKGFPVTTVYSAASGQRPNGKKSATIVKQLEELCK